MVRLKESPCFFDIALHLQKMSLENMQSLTNVYPAKKQLICWKQRKKSIDFLSENHQIYSWKTNGNYSPSRLYRNGMIEGSPFNVDSIDFIGVFGSGGEVE